MRSSRAAIPRPRAADAAATAPASPARSKSCWRPGVRSPIGTGTACSPRSIPPMRSRSSSMPERAELYRRIDARFDAMLAAGALEEVRALAARSLDPRLPAMKAHGVPWLIRHLNGEIALAEAAERRQARHPPLHQAAGHLVPPSAAGLDLGGAARRRADGHRRARASSDFAHVLFGKPASTFPEHAPINRRPSRDSARSRPRPRSRSGRWRRARS